MWLPQAEHIYICSVERVCLTLTDNFGTFSFTYFSSQNGDHEAAGKSYSEPIYASVNTKQRACSYDLWGKLSLLLIIHDTSYIMIWRQHHRQWKLQNKTIEHETQTCMRKKITTKPRESSEGRIWGADQNLWLVVNDLHLSVCSYENTTLVCL